MRAAACRNLHPAAGFTLVEAIVVIAITGVLAAVVAVFIVRPVQGYFASSARAELTDAADTALRRIARDLRLALPNSVRTNGAGTEIEFLSTRTGGRYRAAAAAAGDDLLDFANADNSFAIFGPPVVFTATSAVNQNQIVVFNLGMPGIADAYAGNTQAAHNRRTYSGPLGSVSAISFTPALAFPIESPGNRFHVVDTPVTYACANGQLIRYWGYTIAAAQPGAAALQAAGVARRAVLADGVSACTFTYAPGATASNGLVELQLSLARNGETVRLYHQVHVTNVP